MIISSYGLFWRADEVEWFPGYGKTFRLYGRRGKTGKSLQMCDFWRQEGIYILYGNLGSYYGGLTKHISVIGSAIINGTSTAAIGIDLAGLDFVVS